MWAVDRFNPFFSWASHQRYKVGLAGRCLRNIKIRYTSPSIFVTFKALGSTGLCLNVICTKAKNGSSSYAALAKNKECKSAAFFQMTQQSHRPDRLSKKLYKRQFIFWAWLTSFFNWILVQLQHTCQCMHFLSHSVTSLLTVIHPCLRMIKWRAAKLCFEGHCCRSNAPKDGGSDGIGEGGNRPARLLNRVERASLFISYEQQTQVTPSVSVPSLFFIFLSLSPSLSTCLTPPSFFLSPAQPTEKRLSNTPVSLPASMLDSLPLYTIMTDRKGTGRQQIELHQH